MNILDHEEVLTHELHLLEQPGQALSNYYIYHSEASAFLPPSPSLLDRCAKELKIKQAMSCGNRVNSQFSMLACVLLRIFFGSRKRGDLLEKLKCTLYSPEVLIDRIGGRPAKGLTNIIMKKILVEFFQVMQYHEGRCEPILDKYPIVLEIFTLFLRTILLTMGVSAADHYNRQVSPNEAIPIILDFFDINYHITNGAYVLFEEDLALFIEEKTGESLYGATEQGASPDESNSNGGFNFDCEEYNFEERKDHAPTPCFGEFYEEELNFNRKATSRKNSLNENKIKMANLESKLKGQMIQEENEDEEHEDRRRSSMQVRRNSEDFTNKKVYFDFEEEGEKNELNAVESPKISSPAEDMDPKRDLDSIFTPKESQHGRRANPERDASELQHRIEESTSKSDILRTRNSKKEQKNCNVAILPRANTEAGASSAVSVGSCACTEKKIRKNECYSNVVELSIRPDFSKKPTTPPHLRGLRGNRRVEYETARIENRTGRPNQGYKIPSFLTNRQNMREADSINAELTQGLTHSQRMIRQAVPRQAEQAIPKINFTYSLKKQAHFITEPARIHMATGMAPRQIWATSYTDKRLSHMGRPLSYFTEK